MKKPPRKPRSKSAKPALTFSKYQDSINQDVIVAKYLEGFVKNGNSGRIKRPAKTESLASTPYESPYFSLNTLYENYTGESNWNRSKSLLTRSKKTRPVSAPVYRFGTGSWSGLEDLNGSSSFSASSYSSMSSSILKKPVYKRKHRVLCVQAAVNGSRQKFIRINAPTLTKLLDECTSRLRLPTSARHLYLADGTLVVEPEQLKKDCVVFVSTGEPFKNIYEDLEEIEKIRKASYWTLNGIMLPATRAKQKHSSSSMTSRMLQLIDNKKNRILVFRNGRSSHGVELVSNGFNEFLASCTKRFGLNSGARYLYSWDGKLIKDFDQVPSLPKVIQPSSGTVLGPIWVTQGEAFSSKGALDFLGLMLTNTKARISSTKKLIQELDEILQNDCSHGYINQEVEEEYIMESEILAELELVLPAFTDVFDQLKVIHATEDCMSSSAFKMKHIAEISSDSRLVGGVQGFRIQLYPNGVKSVEPIKMFVNIKELKKGSKAKQDSVVRWLDQINCNDCIMEMLGVSHRSAFVTRAFLCNGEEVTDIDMLSQNAHVWLSMGEGFVPVQYSILSLDLSKVKVTDLWGVKRILQKEPWTCSTVSETKEKRWQSVYHLPQQCEEVKEAEMPRDQQFQFFQQSNETRVEENKVFLQCRQNQSLVLFPEVALVRKGLEYENDGWPESVQQWCVFNDGSIRNKHFSSLVLGMVDKQIAMVLSDEELLDGAPVGIFMKSGNDPKTKWIFTKDGYIQSADNPEYFLTSVDGFELTTNDQQQRQHENDEDDDDDSSPAQKWDITNGGHDHEIVVTNSYDDLQECNYEDSNKAEMVSPLPVVSDCYGGEHISLVVLPLFPINHPLSSKQRWAIKNHEYESSGGLCTKWEQQQLSWPTDHNGVITKASLEGYLMFDAPKLKWKSMKKSSSGTFKVATKTSTPLKVCVLKNGETDATKSCAVVCSASKYENSSSSTKSYDAKFQQFLERSTIVLNLPFAARRVFNERGKELFSLASVKKDELLYISCGDQWSNPAILKSEENNRLMIANLSSDLNKIRQFILYRRQSGLILSGFTDGHSITGVCLIKQPTEEYCKQSVLRLELQDDHRSGVGSSMCSSRSSLYLWEYVDEFLQLRENSNLVLGIAQNQVSTHQDIVICKRQYEKATQRWIMHPDGTVCSKANPQLAITVALPSLKNEFYTTEGVNIYKEARLTLANKKILLNGNSNQVFFLDLMTGHLRAFSTDDVNIETTAANKAGVCTFSVFGDRKVTQPGFICERKDSNEVLSKLLLCEGCGIAMRGKQKLKTLTDFVEFSCAMGEAKQNRIKATGAFQYLTSDIDLSSTECEATLSACELKLLQLRQEASVCGLPNESFHSHPGVRVIARRNGTTSNGVMFVCNSLEQLLDLSTGRLNLPQSARRVYLISGELVTNMDELLKPYYPELTYLKQPTNQFASMGSDEQGMFNVERLDVRVPVDVWISMGEAFLPLKDVERIELLTKYEQLEKQEASKALQIEKHNLRHARARRLTSLSSEQRIKPVLMKAWSEPTLKEDQIEQSISQLQCELEEVKIQQESRARELQIPQKFRRGSKKNVYNLPHALKLLVHSFGSSSGISERNCVVFARNMDELLNDASNKLNLNSCARRLFTEDGVEIFDLNELRRDQTVCVTSGERFIKHRPRRPKQKLSTEEDAKCNDGAEVTSDSDQDENTVTMVLNKPIVTAVPAEKSGPSK